jgi:hypothetical protein
MPPGGYTPFSFLTLLTLLCMLGLSCLTFWLLVRRATSHRRWVALSDWARARGFRYHPIDAQTPAVPEPFDRLAPAARPSPRLWLAGDRVELIELAPAGASAPAETGGPAGTVVTPPKSWHLLIRQVESNWAPTALRPQGKESTLLDLFSLASFPSMIASERFVIFGTDSAAARTLSKSSLPALLPPDIGLFLHGRRLVLDFSDRPFDPIEFDRMVALANHLVGHLPAV